MCIKDTKEFNLERIQKMKYYLYNRERTFYLCKIMNCFDNDASNLQTDERRCSSSGNLMVSVCHTRGDSFLRINVPQGSPESGSIVRVKG